LFGERPRRELAAVTRMHHPCAGSRWVIAMPSALVTSAAVWGRIDGPADDFADPHDIEKDTVGRAV
ncbi:hypothetical protein, partial [Cellulosimicrobium sp. KWT-B]|uniref:hypothetical protein n=1 Tax=Cellulosimicrobium sp. KWT-B TaxID=1981152 RepID=UPI001E4C5C89